MKNSISFLILWIVFIGLVSQACAPAPTPVPPPAPTTAPGATSAPKATTAVTATPSATSTPTPTVLEKCTVSQDGGKCEFKDAGVTFDVRLPQPTAKQLTFTRYALEIFPTPTPSIKAKEIIRVIINVVVTDENNKIVSDFAPPLTMTAKYTEQDASKAKGAANLKLLMYDGKVWSNLDAERNISQGTLTAAIKSFIGKDPHFAFGD
ncbi:MAG: hypothetical protein HY070_12880 [Chloroflexi bacterium]|nr:hypothetical protein [Chloroflexota bacterium]